MIPIPTEVTTTSDAIQTDARRIGVTLSRFTTLEGLDAAERLATSLSDGAKQIRLQVRQMRAQEQRRLRDEAKASEQMASDNARIMAGRAAEGEAA